MLPEPFNPFRFFPGVKFVYQLPEPELTEVIPPKTVFEQILEDITNLPVDGWDRDISEGFCEPKVYYSTFKHRDRKYALHGCLWNTKKPDITLLSVSNDIFTDSQKAVLKQALIVLKEQMDDYLKKRVEAQDKETLKKLFPNCKA